MVEEASGEETGSVYHDETLRRGFEGILVKTHENDAHRYSRAVHLVRHPVDAIFSHYKWKRQIAKVDVVWENHVEAAIRRWRDHARHWLGFPGPRIRIRFEDLKADASEVLSEVLSWLGRAHTEDDLDRAVEATRLEKMRESAPDDVAEEFFRKGKTGDGRGAFSREQRHRLESELGSLLDRFGYQLDT